jgi:Spy/CpxP family protein refolding chaperone
MELMEMRRITRLVAVLLAAFAAVSLSAAAASAMVTPPQPDPIVIVDR